jgi:D-3-phosphoglycerate dehydrogenase
MHAAFVDANPALRAIAERLGPALPGLTLSFGHPGIAPEALPDALAGARIAVIDHTAFPIDIARRCEGVTDVVFLGTGARSYMDPEALAGLGIAVHIIKGYGDTAVAECTIGLLFAAARGFAAMDRGMRAGQWLRTEGAQLAGKTLGLIGFGGIAAETARIAAGIGMKVLAWNRTPKSHPGVEFVPIERLLARATRSPAPAPERRDARLPLARADRDDAARRPAREHRARRARRRGGDDRGARAGRLGHAALDVFDTEPLPPATC